MPASVGGLGTAYDRIAKEYDNRTSHLSESQSRLSEALRVGPCARILDLGCGTGVHAVELALRAPNVEIVGVDCSSAMLDTARRRASESGLSMVTHCCGAEAFVRDAPAESFDVVTLRFSLGYLDWRRLLPELPNLLRPGGRIGLIGNSSRSGWQAYETYREMVSELGIEEVTRGTPDSLDELRDILTATGGQIEDAWSDSFRLWFTSGADAAGWLRESGHASHPALEALPEPVAQSLWQFFATRLERYAEQRGVPLDFETLAIVAKFRGPPAR